MNSQTTNQDKGSQRIIISASYAMLFIVFLFRSFDRDIKWRIVSMIAYQYCIHIEEEALEAAFGSEYDEYKKRTWKLFPGLWRDISYIQYTFRTKLSKSELFQKVILNE